MKYGELYIEKIQEILKKIKTTQCDAITKAANLMANTIANGGLVHVFGSGHSVIPAMDVFPRYGSFPGFHPLLDPRLMWFNVLGPGGVRELLWLERQEGYVKVFLLNHDLKKEDTMLVFSHGGLNAAPVEAALEAKQRGLKVIAVTSLANYKHAKATHSSGKKLADIADIVIDNCVPPEDALVQINGLREKVAAGSTIAAVAIANMLVAEVAGILTERGIQLHVFVSPNVLGIKEDHNIKVFQTFARLLKKHSDVL